MTATRQFLARRTLFVALLALLLSTGAAWSADWTVEDALKQIDKATKGLRGLTGEVTVTDRQGGTEAGSGSGKASIRTDGRMRLDTGEGGKTILCTQGQMFVYEPAKSLVTEYPLAKHRDQLAQYALIGFEPRGTALKKDFLLTMVEADGKLDDKSIVLLELTPKNQALRAAVSKIHLWIDQANWLPAQQRIFHGGEDTHLTVSYANLSRNDKIDNQLFAPKWPKGTRKQKPE
jgi:outer membrane lipoprotein-sorting protein